MAFPQAASTGTRGRSALLGALLAAAAVMVATRSVSPAFSAGLSAGGTVQAPSAIGASGALAGARSEPRTAMRSKYWEGEWICADCGYIYNERAFGGKFEDQKTGMLCPQCAAPRKRFARKLGDKIGTTLDGGDTPIILFSLACLGIILAIAANALS